MGYAEHYLNKKKTQEKQRQPDPPPADQADRPGELGVEVDVKDPVNEKKIQYRVEVFSQQVNSTGAQSFFHLPDSLVTPGDCLSCGDPLPAGHLYRCALCVQAAAIVSRNHTHKGV